MVERSQGASSRFWGFSLDRYGRPGAAAICLAMQDRGGVDVNLLLFCLWRGQEGSALSAEEIAALDGAGAGEWRDTVIRPLRLARRAMKAPPAAFDPVETERLRATLKRVEIESERLQQRALTDAAKAIGLLARADSAALPAAAIARANAAAYLGSLPGGMPAASGWLDELILLMID